MTKKNNWKRNQKMYKVFGGFQDACAATAAHLKIDKNIFGFVWFTSWNQ